LWGQRLQGLQRSRSHRLIRGELIANHLTPAPLPTRLRACARRPEHPLRLLLPVRAPRRRPRRQLAGRRRPRHANLRSGGGRSARL